MSKPVCSSKEVVNNITALCPVLIATIIIDVLAIWLTFRRGKKEF